MAETTLSNRSDLRPQQDQPQACPFHSLPSEILLEIISAVPFTPANSLAVRLTCRRFHDLLTQHEAPIAKLTAHTTFGRCTLQLFPGLQGIHGFRNLARLHARLATLEQVHEQWLRITGNSPELEWLKGRFEGIHRAGLLLLYHLQDLPLHRQQQRQQKGPEDAMPPPICANCERVKFLRALPATSLACLLFKLIASVKILRLHGPEPINERWRKGDVASRSDVELVCEELLLRHGPWFFVALLRPEDSPGVTGQALGRMHAELESLAYRQHPLQPPTLISIVRRALAEQAGVDVRFAVSKMWEILSTTGFDALVEGDAAVPTERLVKVVRGEEFGEGEGGMKRIF